MRYHKMHRHWRKFGPPVYMAVAGYIGLINLEEEVTTKGKKKKEGNKVQPTNPDSKEPTTRGHIKDLVAMFKSGAIQ